MPHTQCPLCQSASLPFWEDKRRAYVKCAKCSLIFVPASYWVSLKEERSIYDLHDNQIADAGYRRFLSRLFDPMCRLLSPNSTGLEFGCGPGPALASMFNEAGFPMELYDIHYFPDDDVFQREFQFITATEVVEHLKTPREDILRLWGVLGAGGLMGVMTKKARDLTAFKTWHYKNDMTHIAFFSDDTFEYIADWLGAEIAYSSADAVILRRP